MLFHENLHHASSLIRSLHEKHIAVGDREYPLPVFFCAGRWDAFPASFPTSFQDSFQNSLQDPSFLTPLLATQPEILLLGTGQHYRHPPAWLASLAKEHRCGLEVNTTASACRTFNILLGENRAVAAVLWG